MHIINRIILAIAVVVVDFLVFFVPLSGIFLAYVLIFNPPWFRGFLNRLAEVTRR
jgi:hypothetical protein